MPSPEYWLCILYFGLLSLLAIYGIHRGFIAYIYLFGKRPQKARTSRQTYPKVTVQLPIYNEKNVVSRLIDAVCKLTWPRHALEIQVLDDSTDETTTLIDNCVSYWQQKGLNITTIRRTTRQGYKAGALAYGMRTASGEYIAIFDADFIPPQDFLQRCIAPFQSPRVGMVQARWEHHNRQQNLLTQTSSILLDGHFVLEHTARYYSGRFFNFNGTAGIWRKQCIMEAGGWQHDTITEDLDLSYRAQLCGWQFVFFPDYTVPAEVPAHMSAFKSQQYRWAKGTFQTAKKLLPVIAKTHFPSKIKLEALIHLTSNVGYPATLCIALLMPFCAFIRHQHELSWALHLDIIAFCCTTGSIGAFYTLSQQQAHPQRWLASAWKIPLAMMLAVGLAVNQTKAAYAGLYSHDTTFVRTPKSGEDSSTAYHLPWEWSCLFEIGLGLYCLSSAYWLFTYTIWQSIPFLLLFGWGFLYVGFCSFLDGLQMCTTKPTTSPSHADPETFAAVRDASHIHSSKPVLQHPQNQVPKPEVPSA